MATIVKRTSKTGIVAFQVKFTINGKRPTVTLSHAYSRADAEEVGRLGGKIIDSIRYGTELDARTKRQIDQLSPDLRKRFENAGLLEPSKRITAFQLWDRFTDNPDGRKDSTILTYTTAQDRFFSFFKKNSDPNAITVEDGRKFREWLTKEGRKKKGYSEATIAATISKIRTVFRWGMEEGYLSENVFLKVRRGSYENKDREHYITPEDYLALLDACPSQEWRVFISLMRIGGLRFSEALAMKWVDINWDKDLMKVHSPKTEHHVGHDYRLVPLFPELRKELEELDAMAEPEEVHVLDRLYGESSQNLRKVFKDRIIFQAGLKPWPRLFHNLRGSRSNELFREFTIFDASSWMGQSAKVAQHHYINSNNSTLIKKASTFQTIPASATGATETEVTPTYP